MNAAQRFRRIADIPADATCRCCPAPGVRLHSQIVYCEMHYRIRQMRNCARSRAKAIPDLRLLEAMADSLMRAGMVCQDCGKTMTWLIVENKRADQVTLQHYRDGRFGLVCGTCNVKHGHLPGDMFLTLPPEHKRCPQCSEVKPLADYPSKGKPHFSWCRACKTRRTLEARRRNPERDLAVRRARYAYLKSIGQLPPKPCQSKAAKAARKALREAATQERAQ